MTPLIKSFFTDMAMEITNDATHRFLVDTVIQRSRYRTVI